MVAAMHKPASAKPYATMRAADLVERTAPLSWLVQGLLPEGSASILGGAPKTGKSFFALDLAVAVASGTPCAGCFDVPAKAPVTLLAAEDPDAVVLFRLDALARARGLALDALLIDIIVEPGVRLPDGLERLAATLAESRPGLLVLDPLIRIHRADENSATEMSAILDGLRSLARASKTAIMLVHHMRKAPAGASSGSALRGSSDLAAFGDTNLYLRRLSADGTLELKIEHRAAACPAPLRIKLHAATGPQPVARFDVVTRAADTDPLAPKLLAILASSSAPVTSVALREKLGVRNQAVARCLHELLAVGRVVRAGRNGWLLARAAT